LSDPLHGVSADTTRGHAGVHRKETMQQMDDTESLGAVGGSAVRRELDGYDLLLLEAIASARRRGVSWGEMVEHMHLMTMPGRGEQLLDDDVETFRSEFEPPELRQVTV
jgi:hypothetical protein